MKFRTMIVFLAIAAPFGTAQTSMQLLRSELTLSGNQQTTTYQNPVLTSEKKSPATAVLYSLLLPGLGEWYVDRFDLGKYSLISEAGLWLSYYSLQRYGAWMRDDARQYAVVHASAQVTGKNDQYFVDLGNFNDTYEYNEKKLIDRTPDRLYDVDQGYYWQWDTDENRRAYRALRVSSEKVFNNSKFIIGAVIVNHIISAVNAARLARNYNTARDSELSFWRMESSLLGSGALPDGIQLKLIRSF
ncbi:MAG: hypothetical protein ACYC09_08130 [Bacteroidota bacterium]